MTGLLVLNAVSKRFSDTTAIRDIDLDIEAGRTTVLLGPSGCGKSTLLRMMIGLLRPDSGRVLFDGHELSGDKLPIARRRMGYVVQGGGLFPHLSAGQNVTLTARQLRWETPRINQRLQELASVTQLSMETLDRYPAQLSGGQIQRVSLMRALMLDPDLLLLDEPLGALDPMTRFELQNDLRAIFDRLHRTVVLVTHDLAEAAFFGHHIVLLREGAVVQQGSFDQLLHDPADPFVTQFINAQRPPPGLAAS
jgi:osmoprotectant transport system ATP-binding protein